MWEYAVSAWSWSPNTRFVLENCSDTTGYNWNGPWGWTGDKTGIHKTVPLYVWTSIQPAKLSVFFQSYDFSFSMIHLSTFCPHVGLQRWLKHHGTELKVVNLLFFWFSAALGDEKISKKFRVRGYWPHQYSRSLWIHMCTQHWQ